MQKSCSIIIIFLIIFSVPATCKAKSVVMTNFGYLVDNSLKYDKQTIVVQGEAIGEPMKRGKYTWVNIGDGSNAIGIWMKNEDAEKVKTFGDYKHRGDILKVTGIFNRACSEHGGDLDIHAVSVEIQTGGYYDAAPADKNIIIAAAVLTLVTIGIAGIYIYRKKADR